MGKDSVNGFNQLRYRAEYSKSNRAICKGCKDKIDKDILRMAKMVRSRHFDGLTPNWFHYECFFENFKPKSTDDIANYSDLRPEDKQRINADIEARKKSKTPKLSPKKRKRSENENEENRTKKFRKDSIEDDQELEFRLQFQTDLLNRYMNALKTIEGPAIDKLIESNDLKRFDDWMDNIEMLADCFAFGVPKPCPECGDKLRFQTNTYICTSRLDGWTDCDYETLKPERIPLLIPSSLDDQHEIFRSYEFILRSREILGADSETFDGKLLNDTNGKRKSFSKTKARRSRGRSSGAYDMTFLPLEN